MLLRPQKGRHLTAVVQTKIDRARAEKNVKLLVCQKPTRTVLNKSLIVFLLKSIL